MRHVRAAVGRSSRSAVVLPWAALYRDPCAAAPEIGLANGRLRLPWPNVIAVCEPGDIPFGILSVFPGGWCCASPSGGALGMFAGLSGQGVWWRHGTVNS